MTSCVFFFLEFLATFLTYDQKQHFQFLVCGSKTWQAINHDKHSRKKNPNKKNKKKNKMKYANNLSNLQVFFINFSKDS